MGFDESDVLTVDVIARDTCLRTAIELGTLLKNDL